MSFRQTVETIYTAEGSKGFTRGLTASLLKNSMMTGQFFSTLFYSELMLRRTGMFNDTQVQMIAGATTKAIQTVLVNPITIIKTRLEVVGFNEYNGVIDAAKQIYTKEGSGAFFTGLRISLIRDVPFSSIWYPTYIFFRGHLFQFYDYEMSHNPNVSSMQRLKALAVISSLSSIMANIVACTVTHPIDLIRTRLFFKAFNSDLNQHYSGLFNGCKKIYDHDGIKGFYKGLLPRIMRKGLGSIIMWTFYEYLIDKKDAFWSIGG